MIAQVGLLNATTYDPNDRREAYRLGIAAWCRAKRATVAAGALSRAGQALLALLEDVVAARLDERNLVPNVGMASVAVWDTVGSMGIPEYTDAGRSDILRFTDTSLSTKVARGFHAMAIDELRVDFPVTKWMPREGIEQVWFVGAHCDVGGGYTPAESYLSDIGLGWMMRKLASVDVTFAVPLPYTPKPAVLGGPFHTPWTAPPFNLMERVARRVEPTDVLHATVRARWTGAEPPYRPTSMGGFGDGIASARIDETAFA
jgi:glutathione S-transferase